MHQESIELNKLAAPLLLKCGPQLSLKFGINWLLNRKKLMIFPNCDPLTVLQSLDVIVRPAHGFEFDMPDLDLYLFLRKQVDIFIPNIYILAKHLDEISRVEVALGIWCFIFRGFDYSQNYKLQILKEYSCFIDNLGLNL
jgi:hypothetical protein